MSASSPPPFHLAFPVRDLARTREFYEGVLGCTVGRSTAAWIDLDFFGHQLTAHLAPAECRAPAENPVEGTSTPVRHFGAVLGPEAWAALRDRIVAAGHPFLIEPFLRYPGRVGEQSTFFVLDPSDNALEFKSMSRAEQLFAS